MLSVGLLNARATACAAVAIALLALGHRVTRADDSAGKSPRAATGPKAQVQRVDHVRVFIEYLEIAVPGSGAIPENAAAGIEVARGDALVWSRNFDSYLNIFRMGPIITPPGTELTLTVWREAAGRKRPIAKIPFRVPEKPLSKTFAQGSLKKMTVVTTPVDVWAIPDMPVVVPFALEDAARKLLEAALVDFHARLVDATEGHVRIERFSVHEPPLPPGLDSSTPSAIHVSAATNGKSPICAHVMGTPSQPGRIPIEIGKRGNGSASRLGAALMHEFGHAYFGLEDEYLAGGEVGCPDRDTDSAPGEACFMNAPRSAGREACRPANHDENGDTAQTAHHQTDCWTKMTSILRAEVGLSLIRDKPLDGPAPSSAPAIAFSAGTDVMDFTDSGSALSDDSINEVVQHHGAAVGKCLVRTGERTAVIEFTIRGVDGRVIRAAVNGKTNGPLATCTRKVMEKMQFPKFSASHTTARVQISR